MIFNKKKKSTKKLLRSFGKPKTGSFNFELIEKYFKKKDSSNSFHVLSDKTCNDLDFQELFMFTDRTVSKIGQQYLYYKLRTIPTNSNRTAEHEKLIEQFQKNPDFRITVQKQLQNIKNIDAYNITTLFQDEHEKPPKWFFITRVLSIASLLLVFMLPIYPQLGLVLFGIFFLNLVIHFWNKRYLYQYLGSIPQLLLLLKVARELFKNDIFKTLNPKLSKSLSITKKIKYRTLFFKMEAKLQGDAQTLVWGFFELLKVIFLLEPLFLFGILKQLDTKRKEVENLFTFVGEIDFLISVSSLRKGLPNYCIPNIIAKQKTIVAKDAYHPLIHDCITNSIQINNKSILLTGSNMSGKTSFIRTIGINVIAGLTLNTCFAEQFSMPRMRVYSAIRISDDLLNDKSYYFEEVLTIKEMLDMSENEKPNLFLLDEIFKGTNTIERISAGKAVLSSLAKNNSVVLVSTHDIELADLLKDEYELFHFSEKVDNKTVDFDYKLKAGKLKNRNAIRILQINNYPENIISEALKLSEELDGIIAIRE